MKIKSDFVWAILLLITAALFFYLGSSTQALEHEEVLAKNIKEKTGRIQVLEYKIEQLSEELTSRGIFSYPQANIIFEKGNSEAKVIIMLNGRDAIPNLEIERNLVTDYSGGGDNKLQKLMEKGKRTNIGTLSAHNPVAFDVEKFDDVLAMDLVFNSERNQWQQYIRTKKTSEGDLKTFWVITNKESEVIDKHIDEGYPTNADGEVFLGPNSKVKYSEIRMNSIFRPYAISQDLD